MATIPAPLLFAPRAPSRAPAPVVTGAAPPAAPPVDWRMRRFGHTGSSRATGVVVVLVAHALLVAALSQYQPARTAFLEHAPILVQLLPAPRITPTPPPPPPRRVVPQRDVREPPAPTPRPQAAPVVTAPPQPAAPEPVPAAGAAPSFTIAAPAVVEATVAAAPVAAAAPPAPAVTPPRFDADYLRNPAPEYPAVSKRRGEQGRVMLRVLVSVDGEPRAVEIRTSSGFPTLDRVAQETVRGWRFVPARLGANPVEAWVNVPLSFTLSSH